MMQPFARRVGLLLCVGVPAPGGLPCAREVQVKVGCVNNRAISNAPLEMLASAIHRDKTSRRFRVSWYFFTSVRTIDMTALYDRRRRTVKYVSVEVANPEMSMRRVRRQRCLYRGVTDVMLFRLAARNRGAVMGIDGFFSQLPSVGARRHTLR